MTALREAPTRQVRDRDAVTVTVRVVGDRPLVAEGLVAALHAARPCWRVTSDGDVPDLVLRLPGPAEPVVGDAAVVAVAPATEPLPPEDDADGLVVWPTAPETLARTCEIAVRAAGHRRASRRAPQDDAASRAILDAMPMGLAWIDLDGRLLDANRAWCSIFGGLDEVPRGALVATLPLGTLRPPGGDPLPPDSTPHARAARGERVVDEALLLRRPDGSETALTVSAAPAGDPRHPDHVVVLVTDLTGATQAQHRFAGLLDRGDSLILVTDDHRRYVDASQAALDALGYRREEFIGRSFDDVWIQNAESDESSARFSREGRSAGLFQLRRRDGGTVTWEMRSVADAAPGRHLSVGRDVTREVGALRELERSRRRLDLIVETVQTGFVVVEPDGRVSYANPAAFELLAPFDAYATATLREWLVASLDEPEDRADRALERLFESGRPIDMAVRGADGRRFHVRVSQRPAAMDGDGEQARLFAIEDRTMLNRSLQALQEALARQERAEAEFRRLDVFRDTMLSAVSHELRTPLTMIQGGVQTLRARDGLDVEVRSQLLDRIEDNARRLAGLLDDLLDLNRMRRREGMVERSATDVGGLAREVADRVVAVEPRRVVVDDSPLVVDVDASKVERILTNLVTNAVRHTPDGARVWVRASHDGVGVLLEVDDEGPGVPDEQKDAVFGLFRKGASGGGSSGGTGIGLALVKEFARLHEGRAWVEDRPGGGAAFRVWLPAVRLDR